MTLPRFRLPREIRAPAGTIPWRQRLSVALYFDEVYKPGDAIDVLIGHESGSAEVKVAE